MGNLGSWLQSPCVQSQNIPNSSNNLSRSVAMGYALGITLLLHRKSYFVNRPSKWIGKKNLSHGA